jgi:hypothetical protein
MSHNIHPRFALTAKKKDHKSGLQLADYMAAPAGIEPAAHGLGTLSNHFRH